MSLAIDLPMDVRDVADALGLSHTFLYSQIRRGAIPHCRFGRRVKVYSADVLDWLARNYVPRHPQDDDELFTMLIEEARNDISRRTI